MKALLFTLGALMAWAPAVHADVDYRCLYLCARSGQNNSACMGQCSLPDKEAGAVADPAENRVREFPMMRKLNRNELLPPREETHVQEDKDFDCVQQCLRAHMRAETCERGCVIKDPLNDKDRHVLRGQKPDEDKTQLDMKRLVPPKTESEAKKPLAPLDSMPHVKGW